jgi:hypothetical protein
MSCGANRDASLRRQTPTLPTFLVVENRPQDDRYASFLTLRNVRRSGAYFKLIEAAFDLLVEVQVHLTKLWGVVLFARNQYAGTARIAQCICNDSVSDRGGKRQDVEYCIGELLEGLLSAVWMHGSNLTYVARLGFRVHFPHS